MANTPVTSDGDGLQEVFHNSTLGGKGTKKQPLFVKGGSSGVQSVTGLNTNNTDPVNPVVEISVDGSTITGDGTPGNPLVANSSGVDEFIDLVDVPNSYSGQSGKTVVVKLNETGLEFVDGLSPSNLPGTVGVSAATTAALPANTYNNGAGTLTANANGALAVQDGVTLAPGDTLLVWNESDQTHNGKYSVTSLGSVGTPWILTRSTDSDTTTELNDQIVVPAEGTLYGGHTFGQTTADPILGTDNIIYVDYGASQGGGFFVTQAPGGTQSLGQIPLWTSVARRVSKGYSSFTYTPSTGFVLKGTTAAGITLNPFGTSAGNTSEIRFKELVANGSNYLGFKAPDAIGSNLIYILPTTDPVTGQVLQATTPSGNTSTLSWTTVTSSPALSAITAGTGTNTIDSTSFKQEWQWNSLAGTDAFKLSSTSTAAASNAQTLLNVALSGANASALQTTYGAIISNTHTGTTSTNVGLQITASGGASANYGLLVTAGQVGIGTTTPAANRQIEISHATPWIRMTEASTGKYMEIQGASGGDTYFVGSAGSGTFYWYPNNTHVGDFSSSAINFRKTVSVINGNLAVQGTGAGNQFEIYNPSATTGDCWISAFDTTKKYSLTRMDGTAVLYYIVVNKSSPTTAHAMLSVDGSSNVMIGTPAALATTATDGFLYVSACAGVPTGVPTAKTGKIPIVVDSTNNKMYIYSGGAWVALN